MFTSCFTDMLSMFETSEKEKQTFLFEQVSVNHGKLEEYSRKGMLAFLKFALFYACPISIPVDRHQLLIIAEDRI